MSPILVYGVSGVTIATQKNTWCIMNTENKGQISIRAGNEKFRQIRNEANFVFECFIR